MNFLFQGIMIIVSSTAPVDLTDISNAVGAYNHDDHKIYVVPEYKDNKYVLYHEIGHYYYHRHFIGQNAYDHAMFWLEVNKKTGYCPSTTLSHEIIADHYSYWKLGKDMPPEAIAYFKYYK